MKKLLVSLIALSIIAIGAPSFSANAVTNALDKTSNAITSTFNKITKAENDALKAQENAQKAAEKRQKEAQKMMDSLTAGTKEKQLKITTDPAISVKPTEADSKLPMNTFTESSFWNFSTASFFFFSVSFPL